MDTASPIRAVCFDFDGTLIDSEAHYFTTMRDWLAQHYGIAITETEYAHFETHLDDLLLYHLIETGKLPGLTEKDEPRIRETIFDICLERFDELIASEKTRRNAELLHEYHRRIDAPFALVTCSVSDYVTPFIDTYDLRDVFSYVITGEQVEKLKPDPEIYLTTLDVFGITGDEAIAVEDATRGITAALAAGMTVVRPLEYVIDAKPLADIIEVANLAEALSHIEELVTV
jgi:HAD superfamily hydrolase (TIGR01509 family)